MRLAIAKATEGVGLTRENPSVGCVIVRDGALLAIAGTASGGRPHAEEQALAAAGEAARGASVYVTLEPCGARTSGAPSCAERLVLAGVGRVAIACEDASPKASGLGVQRLREAGVEVVTGLLRGEAVRLYDGYVYKPLERPN